MLDKNDEVTRKLVWTIITGDADNSVKIDSIIDLINHFELQSQK